MGLIMLILVGTVPTAYALNCAVSPSQTADFLAVSTQKEFDNNTMLALSQGATRSVTK